MKLFKILLMIRLKKFQKLSISFLIFISTLSINIDAFPSPWLAKINEIEYIFTQDEGVYETFVDSDGRRVSQAKFRKYELKPYIEYGLHENYSVGFSPSFQFVSNVTAAEIDENIGLSYVDVFLKYKLYQGDYDILSYEQKFELPGIYNEKDTPTFGKKETFISSKLLYGNSLYKTNDMKVFLASEIGVKSIFNDLTGNDSGAQLEGDFILGFSFENYEIYFQPSFKKALATYKTRQNLLDRTGYDIYKAELSFLRNFGDYDLMIGVSRDITGRNTALGSSYKVSYIKKIKW